MKSTKFVRYGRVMAAFVLLAGIVFFSIAVFSTLSTRSGQDSHVLAATLDEPAAVTPSQSVTPAISPYVDHMAEYDVELNNLIANWAKSQPTSGQWSVAVKGLVGTDLQADYNGRTVYESASIYKLYMIYALSQVVPTSRWSEKIPGDSRSIDQCVSAMLERSDNACGTAISNWLGWVKAQTFVDRAGYGQTILNRSPVRTSADDTLKFLSDLYNNKTFTPQLRNRIIGDMQKSAFRHGIVAGCPGCTVANKTGNLNGYNHDAAIIEVDTKAFALCVFSKGGSARQIAEITKIVQHYIRSH